MLMTVQFTSLSQCTSHYWLQIDALLQTYLEALANQNIPLARQTFKVLSKLLKEHIKQAERLLIPAHRSLKEDLRWQTDIHSQSHQDILALVDNIHADLKKMATDKADDTDTVNGQALKELITLHKEQTEKGLLPELDDQLDPAQLDQLITQCHLSWQEAHDDLREEIQSIDHALT